MPRGKAEQAEEMGRQLAAKRERLKELQRGRPAAGPAEAIVPLIYDRRAAARKPRKTKRES